MPSARLDACVPPPRTGRRADVLAELASAIAERAVRRRLVIAIDGVDGAGKTVLARELASMAGASREVHRASVDGFHRPRAQRYARGRTAQSFYLDSCDHDAIRTRLVDLWDASVWVDVPFEVSVPRGNARFGEVDATLNPFAALDDVAPEALPNAADPASEVNARYVGGQRLYLTEVSPATRATWVLDNTDVEEPALAGGTRMP